ncbi:YjzC family protein [Acetobacterium bakii]|uniref:YjzC family protein n=1 Tax=Acetobacterium bakii TaxID=52689 RepID=UPI0009F82D43|nr:YjzC family protein [Acetobacterium bakii]
MAKLIPPGTDNQPAGKYIEVGPQGGVVKKPHNATLDPGDRLPPTSKEGNKWKKK